MLFTLALEALSSENSTVCPRATPAWNGEHCVLCADVGLRRAEDGSCVEHCPRNKYARNATSTELYCVRECPHWWDREDAGFCDERLWLWKALGVGAASLLIFILEVILIRKCFCQD